MAKTTYALITKAALDALIAKVKNLEDADSSISQLETLYYASSDSQAPSAPTAQISTSSITYEQWTKVKPSYDENYPYLFSCMQVLLTTGEYIWSNVTEDATYAPDYTTVYSGVCATNADTESKTVSSTTNEVFLLQDGSIAFVCFNYTHSGSTSPTLNVCGTGAKPLCWYEEGAITSVSSDNAWSANDTLTCRYSSADSSWLIISGATAKLEILNGGVFDTVNVTMVNTGTFDDIATLTIDGGIY